MPCEQLYKEYKSLLVDAGLKVGRLCASDINKDISVLCVIDIQYDFLPLPVPSLQLSTTSINAKKGCEMQDESHPPPLAICPSKEISIGAFSVAEGDAILPLVRNLMTNAFAACPVFLTRDYHPYNHCSFNALASQHLPSAKVAPPHSCASAATAEQAPAGPFPPHCVQGTPGSFIHAELALAAAERHQRAASEGQAPRTMIVFKGFSEGIDSFSAFPYQDGGHGRITRAYLSDGEEEERMPVKMAGSEGTACSKSFHKLVHHTIDPHGAIVAFPHKCSSCWTGAFALSCSASCDINMPPDVTAILAAVPMNIAVEQSVTGANASNGINLYICGLALDFCVLDTARNARVAKRSVTNDTNSAADADKKKNERESRYLFNKIVIIINASRAAHIPGVGGFGSGFLSDPKSFISAFYDPIEGEEGAPIVEVVEYQN